MQGNITRNNEIGAINGPWGPFFRVSFDLIIHSLGGDDWTSLLAFRGNGAICDKCKVGDRIPFLLLNNKFGYIQFSNNVVNLNDYFFFDIEVNHWYNIIIEQKSVNRKVKKQKQKTKSS